MKYADPLVSVVIPTINRPHLVIRAVNSALVQSLNEIEIIVIIDGPDEATLKALQQIEDPRLRIRTLSRNLGVSEARNIGVGEARSKWIAFLDDDDEWFPRKLEIQLQTAQRSNHRYPIITCRVIARNEVNDFVWPRRFPKPNESLSEYLFCRKGPFFGEGLIQSSTIFTLKELLRMFPFKSCPGEDLDWLLTVITIKGVGVKFVSETDPLAIWYIEEGRNRGSNRSDWCFPLSWIQTNRHLFTPRAYASLIMTCMGSRVARKRRFEAFLPLLKEAYRYGKPSMIDFLAYVGFWLIPRKAKRWLAAFFSRIYLWFEKYWVLRVEREENL